MAKVANIGSLPQAYEIVKYFFITSLVIIRLNINCADGGEGAMTGSHFRKHLLPPLSPTTSILQNLSLLYVQVGRQPSRHRGQLLGLGCSQSLESRGTQNTQVETKRAAS